MAEDYKQRSQQRMRDTVSSQSSVDLRALRRLYKRAAAVVKWKSRLLPDPCESKDHNEFVIATISLEIDEKKDLVRSDKLAHYNFHAIHNLTEDAFNRIFSQLKDSVGSAVENGAQFVCANELGLPMCCTDSDYYRIKEAEFAESMYGYANDKSAYILPGTYHCRHTLHNLAPIFYPGQLSADAPVLHAKRTCASSVGERILVPYNREVRFYKTLWGLIGLLICLDSYDPSLIFELVRAREFQGQRTDIMFVPSLNGNTGPGREACQDMSYLLLNIVVLTNTDHYGGNSECVWMCGEQVPISERLSNGTNLYRIKKSELRLKASELDQVRSTAFRTVFGHASTPRISLASNTFRRPPVNEPNPVDQHNS